MSYPPCDCKHNAWSHGTQTGYPREGEPCHAAVFDVEGQLTDQECGCPGYHAASHAEASSLNDESRTTNVHSEKSLVGTSQNLDPVSVPLPTAYETLPS